MNALSPIFFKPSGNLTRVSFGQAEKAPSVISVIFGRDTSASPEPLKALTPSFVTLSGILIFAKSVQPAKALAPISVTLPSDGIMLVLQPTTSFFEDFSIRQLSTLKNSVLFLSTVIEVSPGQYANAEEAIHVTAEGTVSCVNLLRPQKAEEPIEVTLPSDGITLEAQPAIRLPEDISVRQLPASLKNVFFSSTVMLSREGQSENAPAPIFVTFAGIFMLVRLPQP